MEKILFVEDKSYYQNLGLISEELKSNYDLEFNGAKQYKISEKELKKYSLVISYLYHSPLSNFIILKAKRYNIPTLLVADGIFEWANAFKNPMTKSYNLNLYHPILHDYFLCLGKETKMYFENLGVTSKMYLPERVLEKKRKISLPNNKKILITTAKTPYFNEQEKKRLVKLMKKVIKVLKKRKNDYIFRIFDEGLINELNITENNNYTDGNFETVLQEVDVVITTPSSIILEAMYHGRAVGQLNYRNVPLFLQSGWNISLSCNLYKTIDSLIKLEKERLQFQNKELKKYISNNSVEDHINEVINSSIEEKELFIDENLYNLINSKFNINFENLFRKVYLKLKNINFIKKLKSVINFIKK